MKYTAPVRYFGEVYGGGDYGANTFSGTDSAPDQNTGGSPVADTPGAQPVPSTPGTGTGTGTGTPPAPQTPLSTGGQGGVEVAWVLALIPLAVLIIYVRMLWKRKARRNSGS